MEKKILPFKILNLLQEKTDETHHLQQKQIVELLAEEGFDCDRRTVRASVDLLQEVGYDIPYDEGYYLAERVFEDAELRMLIDSVLFSKVLTVRQSGRLITKIKNLGNENFRKKVPDIKMLSGIGWSQNKEFLLTVTALNEAISRKHKVTFVYQKYGADLKLHDSGHLHKVSPYYLLAANGYYYLMCNEENHDNVIYYRIDRMVKVRELNEKIKNKTRIKGIGYLQEMPKHMAEHIYMFSGGSVDVEMKTTPSMVSDLVDWFGKDIEVKQVGENEIRARVRCNENAIFYWLLQYGMSVEVVKPQSLRDKMRDAVVNLQKKYC